MKKPQCLAMLVGRIALILSVLTLFGAFSSTAFAIPAQNAYVRVVHASPEAGPVDVFVDGNQLLNNFTFSSVTDYVPVPAGQHTVQVAPAGQGAAASVINETVSVNSGVPYTVAAVGTKAEGFALQPFVDDNMVTSGNAKVRVYHLSPNAGPVNVAAAGQTAISGLSYKNASDYLSVPPGAYTFDVTAVQAGATVPVSATLNTDTVYSVFAVGLYQGTPALTFVVGVATGIPGMPSTGSDPAAMNTAMLPMALGATALLLAGIGIAARRYAQSQK